MTFDGPGYEEMSLAVVRQFLRDHEHHEVKRYRNLETGRTYIACHLCQGYTIDCVSSGWLSAGAA